MKYIPKVGIITLGDPREEVPWRREEDKLHEELINILKGREEIEVVYPRKVIREYKDVMETVKDMTRNEIDLLLLYIPIWTYPVMAVVGAREAIERGAQLVIVYSDRGLSGILASAGALKQIGIRSKLIYCKKEELVRNIIKFAKACMVVNRLKGMRYGVIGGRALGMYTVVDDPIKWQREFGVDIDHIDQVEVLREAEKIPEDKINTYLGWIQKNFGLIEYDNKMLTSDILKKQIRVYIALKRIINKYNFDFCGLKCQPELSDHYVCACLAIALINDPYDAEGHKEPIVCACEVDHDGALTMQILKIISGGKPTTLMDVLSYDEEKELLYLGNCGGMATWFTKRSKDPGENLSEVHLRPQIQGKAGGAATQYVADEGIFTIARLFREGDEYRMVLIKSKAVKVPRENLKRDMWPWPHIVVKFKRSDFFKLLDVLGANHLHATEGDYIEELIEFCKLKDIKYVIFNEAEAP